MPADQEDSGPIADIPASEPAPEQPLPEYPAERESAGLPEFEQPKPLDPIPGLDERVESPQPVGELLEFSDAPSGAVELPEHAAPPPDHELLEEPAAPKAPEATSPFPPEFMAAAEAAGVERSDDDLPDDLQFTEPEPLRDEPASGITIEETTFPELAEMQKGDLSGRREGGEGASEQMVELQVEIVGLLQQMNAHLEALVANSGQGVTLG